MSDVGKNPSSTFMEGRSTLGKAGSTGHHNVKSASFPLPLMR